MQFLTPLLSPADYLAKYELEEKMWHDKALEAYQAATAKYMHHCTKLLVKWKQTGKSKEQAGQVFMNADYKFKLFNQAHPDWQTSLPKEPHFSHLYQPTVMHRQGKEEVKVPGETTKQWLIRQIFGSMYVLYVRIFFPCCTMFLAQNLMYHHLMQSTKRTFSL